MNDGSYKGNKVVVAGAGRSGLAAARFLTAKGAKVFLADEREETLAGEEAFRLATEGITLLPGPFSLEAWEGAELLVLSPGVPADREPFETLRSRGTELIGELELAWRHLTGKVIAITGTKGKSTTTSLVGEALMEERLDIRIGGNIGKPLTEQIAACTVETLFVVEVSSFQLETVKEFHPFMAALLNYSPDHLDRYPDEESYKVAKLRIFENQEEGDFVVANLDDPVVVEMAGRSRGKRLLFSRRGELPRGAEGAFLRGDDFVIRLGEDETTVLNSRDLKLRGTHNEENVLAACVMARLAGASPGALRRAFSGFAGLEHAFEHVADVRGVGFINDSKATNVAAALRGLESLPGPVVLIMGGKSKGGDFSLMRGEIGKKVKNILLIGESADMLRERFSDLASCTVSESLGEAVRRAYRLAGGKGTVLFAPACASFDMFGDYRERGEVFKLAVAELSTEEED